jgi:hypothetical protein
MPISQSYQGKHFFTVEAGQRVATPLLLVLVLVDVTDLIFAVDSIPAIFGVTQDPFICSRRTSSRFLASARCISCWRRWSTDSICSSTGSR